MMRIVTLLLIVIPSCARSSKIEGLSARETITSIDRPWLASALAEAYGSRAALLQGHEVDLKIPKANLGSHVYAFGVICSHGTLCGKGASESAPHLVVLERQDDQLVLSDAGPTAAGATVDTVARWGIRDEDADFVYAYPVAQYGDIAWVSADGTGPTASQAVVLDRFFHDFRVGPRGSWFHETLHYEYGETTTDVFGRSHRDAGTDTLSVYLAEPAETSGFTPKLPLSNTGFFVTGYDVLDQLIYDGSEPFNRDQRLSLLWRRERTLEWVISSKDGTPLAPSIYTAIAQGILAWQPALPATLVLKVRPAAPGEELDSPFINTLVYNYDASYRGNTTSAADPRTGEIQRAAISIFGPRDFQARAASIQPRSSNPLSPDLRVRYGTASLRKTCDLEMNRPDSAAALNAQDSSQVLRGIVSHEVGHALGLRHNFEGSLWDEDLARYPVGSSIMDYPQHDSFHSLTIGPYDLQAVRWAYQDVEPTVSYPYCADELQDEIRLHGLSAPTCRKYDAPTHDPFSYYYTRMRRLVADTIPNGQLAEPATQLEGMQNLFTYLRDPGSFGSDQGKLIQVLALLQSLSDFAKPSQTAAPSAKILADKWQTVAKVVALLDFNLHDKGLLSDETLYKYRDTLQPLYAWVAGTSSGTGNWVLRLTVVKTIAAWQATPYGLALAAQLESALNKTQSDDALGIENAYLLRLFRLGRSSPLITSQISLPPMTAEM